MIIGKNVSLTYDTNSCKKALDNVSFEIPLNQITSFIGKSGAGKTTVLRCISELQKNYAGNIAFEGKELRTFSAQERASIVGFVFQDFNLFSNLTVIENCVQSLIVVKKLARAAAYQKAFQMLGLLGMESYKNSYPKQLSGGQQQRVAIARALCLDPKLLLLDEPTSALDPENTAILVGILKKLSKRGVTIALSSQDMMFVKMVTDNVILMENGQIVELLDGRKNTSMSLGGKISNFLNFGT